MEDGVIYPLANGQVMRLDVDDEHYYYGNPPDEERKYYLAVTRVIDIGGPFPEGLRQWLSASTYDEQKERLQVTGDRGKKLHDALEQLMHKVELQKRDYPSQYEQDALWTFRRMMRFLRPSKFDTELIVADHDLRVAGTMDFRGFVDAWKLEALLNPLKYLEIDSDGDLMLKERWLNLPSEMKGRTHIIIDWKFTGRNAYSHKVQVAAYKTMYNKCYKGRNVSRAFTWRYSSRHKFSFDFSESLLDYRSFKRVYNTTIEFLGEFPEPPTIKRFPDSIRLFEEAPTKI